MPALDLKVLVLYAQLGEHLGKAPAHLDRPGGVLCRVADLETSQANWLGEVVVDVLLEAGADDLLLFLRDDLPFAIPNLEGHVQVERRSVWIG